MVTILEYCQWILLIISGLLSIICFIFMQQMMQQIDDLNDRVFRLMAGLEQSNTTERVSNWRDSRVRPSFKDKPL